MCGIVGYIGTKKAKDISDLELKQLANIILNWNFKCKKPTDFKKAQVMFMDSLVTLKPLTKVRVIYEITE